MSKRTIQSKRAAALIRETKKRLAIQQINPTGIKVVYAAKDVDAQRRLREMNHPFSPTIAGLSRAPLPPVKDEE